MTFIDITERKRARNALGAAHAAAELFINSVPSILAGLDGEGRIIRWNLAAAGTFGLEDVDVLGKHLARCGIRWLSRDVEERVKALSSINTQVKWDDLWFEMNGEHRLLGLTATKIELANSENVMFLIVGADVTDRRLAEEELRSKTAFLEAQTNATLDGILVTDENRNKLLQNRRFVEMFTIPQWICDEANDQSLVEFLLSEVKDPEQFTRQVQYLYSHRNETSQDEIEFTGGMIVDRYSSPVVGKDGTHYGRIWIFRDITERKRNEEAVRKLSLAVEQSPVSVLITDLKGRITYVNHRFSETSGYSLQEVLGQNPSIFKSGHTPPETYKEMWKTIALGKEWRSEMCNKKKNGELYWESLVISPIKDSKGETAHFIAFKEDVTEARNRESQLRQAQKLEGIGQLAAGIAHEINTPIQFIGDNTRFIKESWTDLAPAISLLQGLPLPGTAETNAAGVLGRLGDIVQRVDVEYLCQEMPRAIEQSLDGISRVTKIVQAMKEFSHPGSNEKQLADINKAILTTLTVARNELKYVAEVETFLASDLELVPCHISEFSQVILNLLVNSAHAIAQVVGDGAKGKGKITIRTRQDPDWTTISIQDTGTGIPAEIRSRIFEPFFTTKGVGKGTGQGLALAHNTIVKKHDGRLWFESESAKGTTFYIQLPAAKPSQTYGSDSNTVEHAKV